MTMNAYKIIGTLAMPFAILTLLLPMLSTPVSRHLAFWEGQFKVDDYRMKVEVGFWGACVSRTEPSHNGTEEFNDLRCTEVKAGYNLKMSDLVPEAAGELSTTQTIFMFWLPVAAVIAAASLGLSFSPNYYQWKQAAILSIVSGSIAFGTFLAFMVVFSGLTSEIRDTESKKTLPMKAGLRGDSFFPFASAFLLFLSAGLFWTAYRQEFYRKHRQMNSSRSEADRVSLTKFRRRNRRHRSTSRRKQDAEELEQDEDNQSGDSSEHETDGTSYRESDREEDIESSSPPFQKQEPSESNSAPSQVRSAVRLPPPPPLRAHSSRERNSSRE